MLLDRGTAFISACASVSGAMKQMLLSFKRQHLDAARAASTKHMLLKLKETATKHMLLKLKDTVPRRCRIYETQAFKA